MSIDLFIPKVREPDTEPDTYGVTYHSNGTEHIKSGSDSDKDFARRDLERKIEEGYTNAHLFEVKRSIDEDTLRQIWFSIEERKNPKYVETEAVLRVDIKEGTLEYVGLYSRGYGREPSAIQYSEFSLDGQFREKDVGHSLGGIVVSYFIRGISGWNNINKKFDDLRMANIQDNEGRPIGIPRLDVGGLVSHNPRPYDSL